MPVKIVIIKVVRLIRFLLVIAANLLVVLVHRIVVALQVLVRPLEEGAPVVGVAEVGKNFSCFFFVLC
jgi:hypothetical protein